jgi:long-subunit acyl-CoA synthetase (AMP-forming)
MSRILAAIRRHGVRDAPLVALSGPAGAWTYAQLPERIEQTASWLKSLATRPGAPVAVALDNSPAAVLVDLALMRLGWSSLPLPPFFTPAQRAHALADCGAALLLESDAGASTRIAGEGVRATQLRNLPRALPPGTAKISYTSGSTGRPKGVCLSLAQMEAVAASLVSVIGEDYAGAHLPVLPLSVLLENVAGLYTTLLAGGRYHLLAPAELGLSDPFRPDLPRLVAAIAGEHANSLILVPELLRGLLTVMSAGGVRFPDLEFVAVGGAKVSPRLLEQAERLGVPVYEGYGLTECASVVALNTPTARRFGTVGRPLPHLQAYIEDGEIVIGPQPFLGYVGAEPQAGPVRTGDLGSIDPYGYLRLDGRRDALIVTSFGRNVSPEWVESELMAEAEIRQALVFGDGAPSLSAILTPLHAHLPQAAVAVAVERANARLPSYARIERWSLRPPFDPAAGELTGNGRPRRATILAHHGPPA